MFNVAIEREKQCYFAPTTTPFKAETVTIRVQ